MQLSTALLALGLADKVGEQEAVKTLYTWDGIRTFFKKGEGGSPSLAYPILVHLLTPVSAVSPSQACMVCTNRSSS